VRIVFVFVCSLSQSLKVKWQQTLAKFCPLASDCTENRGLLVAQALLQVTAKLAQQANCLTFCEKALASNILLCLIKQILGKTAGLFSHSALTFLALLSYSFCLLHSCEVGTLLAGGFLSQHNATVNAMQQALQTLSAAAVTINACL